ncbi:conserved oligomeric Golgi complex subunit 7-like [Acropora millepora]|uniref:conserved oligomeric Golgi complex subunit 7-like n=1 Tax=Acropora millepora TaxID=45264 RepID=UPI001CF1E915|nr:conserved oligomeric Golgi complex subunit 7-like [Acropora millepora]
MDFSKFSDDNFDVKEWVNSALRIRDDRTPIDAHASNLVMKLQLFIQEVNNALEETSMQSVNNIPRVLREIESIRHDASLLKEQMTLVKEDIRAVEETTAQSMKMLMELDTVKSRMQDASRALQEADNWTVLSSDVDKVFESGDVKAIAAKLEGMHRSLTVLQDVPDYAQRRRLLEGLKNRLEALLSPKIVAAFNNHSLDDTKEYVKIFTNIERLDQLQSYYVRCHKAKLQKTWREVPTEDPNKSMLEWVSKFYDLILSTWHTEVSWCAQVFNEPGSVLCTLITQTLTHLEPSLSSCINEFITKESNIIEKLIELRRVTLRFAHGLETAISQQQQDKCSTLSVELLVDAVFSPYVPYLLDYPTLQQAFLTEQLQAMRLHADGLMETAGFMAESVEKIFHLSEQAVDCCINLTDGYGIHGLCHVLEEFFGAYAGRLDECISMLRKECSLDADPKMAELPSEGISEDWTMFQNAFRLIQICGDLLLKMEILDERLLAAIFMFEEDSQTPEKPQEKSASSPRPFRWFNYLQKERPAEFNALNELKQKLKSAGESAVVLPVVADQFQSLNERVHTFAFDIIFIQIRQQLAQTPKLQVWSAKSPESGAALSDELPTFSLSPLGYITHIGDYLLTLPQQLEPFITQDNPGLAAAMKAGNLPFPDIQDQDEHNPGSYWLGSIARGTMHVYTESILRIHELTPYSTQQLLADIDYFCNVLEALEVTPSQMLTHINVLLKASPDKFHEVATDLGVEDRIMVAIAGIRNIR